MVTTPLLAKPPNASRASMIPPAKRAVRPPSRAKYGGYRREVRAPKTEMMTAVAIQASTLIPTSRDAT
jgi:hypothetical protein